MEAKQTIIDTPNSVSIEDVPDTLVEACRYFSDLTTATLFFAALRWPAGVVCPYCQSAEVGFVSTRRIFKCKQKECRKQFSPKAGTIFEDSPLSIDKWLIAIWMISNCKNGVSSYEISRDLGVTQKTAWFMLHRIRVAMQTGSFEKFDGTVEADETFVGGKAKNMHKDKREEKIHGRGAVGKAIVMGILQRGDIYTDPKTGDTKKTPSKVKANVIPNTSRESLHLAVESTVKPGAELMTDAARGYRGLDAKYAHAFVDHAVKYVEGRIYTNGLENFWSLTKRALKGTYVSVEPGHLLAYIDEQAFRFNERGMKDNGRFLSVLSSVTGKRLTYRTLIGNPQGIDSPDPLRGGLRAD